MNKFWNAKRTAWLCAGTAALVVLMVATAVVPHAAHYAYMTLPLQVKVPVQVVTYTYKPVANYLRDPQYFGQVEWLPFGVDGNGW